MFGANDLLTGLPDMHESPNVLEVVHKSTQGNGQFSGGKDQGELGAMQI